MDLFNELTAELEKTDFSWRFINDQLNILRFSRGRDSAEFTKDKIVEFSKFYRTFYLCHKENIENIYRACSTISRKYMDAVNQYAGYSNAEMVKYLMLHNSKKQVFMWDSDIENARHFKFSDKESMTTAIRQFKEMYSSL